MPIDTEGDGQLREFTESEIAAMNIRTFDVRSGGHPTETRKPDESTMNRTFLVDWASRYDFVELVLGNSIMWSDDTDPENVITKISRLLPDPKYGRHPDFDQIMATRIDEIRGHGKGIDDVDGMPAYSDAEITVFYEHVPFDPGSDNASSLQVEQSRYITISDSIRSEAEVYGPLPGGTFKATRSGGGGLSGIQAPYNFSISRPVEKFTIWWEKLPWALVSTDGALFERLYFGEEASEPFVPFIGTVNSHELAFTAFNRRYAAGTLLLESVELQKIRSPLAESAMGGLRARVGFNYAFSPRGWLDMYLLDPAAPSNSGYYRMSANGTYYAVADMPDNNGMYNVRDHNDLWDANLTVV